ncbi:MAG: hypothetical protein HY903_06950 [Deltaproteobacteria bacterium]|nr:hypothetical protein [Deltaproteobacteria bacterium]
MARMRCHLLPVATLAAASWAPAGCSRTDLVVVTCQEAVTPDGRCVTAGDPTANVDGDGGPDGGGSADGADDSPIGDLGPCTTIAGDFLGNNYPAITVQEWDNTRYVATSFNADLEAGTLCGVLVTLTKVGTPPGTLYVSIWSDAGGAAPTKPDARLGDESTGVAATSIVGGVDTRFSDVTGVTLVALTKYWLVLRSDAPTFDGANYVNWVRASNTETFGIRWSRDAVSWGDYQNGRASFQLLK